MSDDRWKCPDCGRIIVDPLAPIAACACGSERVQLRDWPAADDWEPPEWPDDAEFSPDPFEVETSIRFENASVPLEPATSYVDDAPVQTDG